MMSAYTLDITDENAANQYSSVKKLHPNTGQWLVHCSAGVGRTGNVIYLHVLFLERAKIDVIHYKVEDYKFSNSCYFRKIYCN